MIDWKKKQEKDHPTRARRVVGESPHAEQLGSLGNPAVMIGVLWDY